MTGIATSVTSETRLDLYREAERKLWKHHRLEPTERFLDLETQAVRVRVLEVGSGEPLLFVHGTVGQGSWASLIQELPGFRSIVLERPGWGLSSALDFTGQKYDTLVAEILSGALDALELERAHVIGGSIGNVWALRLAAQHPSRVRRLVLLGGGPIVAEIGVTGIIRVLASPAGVLMVRLQDKPGVVRSMLRHSGHGASLRARRIPDEFIDWRVALARETDSMRHERGMVCAVVKGKAWRPGLTFEAGELGAIPHAVLHVYGTADAVGSPEIWRHVAGALPRGELLLVDGAGHMPWFDDPKRVAAGVSRFLTG